MLSMLTPLLFQLSVGVAPSEVKTLLAATVRVEVAEQRFVSVRVDTVPSTARAAALVNRRARVFSYLVEHQLPPKRLYAGLLESSESPAAVVLRNLGSDTAAVRRIGDYLALAVSTPEVLTQVTGRRSVTEAEVLAITARFFHPVVQPNKRIGFFRCAGVNGIEGLGERRNPEQEAFAFWGLAAIVFDADSSSADAHDVASDFQRVKTAFSAAVTERDVTSSAVDKAREELYGQMAASAARARVMRRAYERISPQLPFRVHEWEIAAR